MACVFLKLHRVFFDEFAIFEPDLDHSEDENRYVVLGTSIRQKILLVVHVLRGERIRLISARPATPMERRQYDENVDEMEMRDEYDFSNAIRNPYVQKFGDLNLVSLDPDVREAFPDSRAVNEALRLLIKTAKSAQEFSKTS